jgi:hypothetical protein
MNSFFLIPSSSSNAPSFSSVRLLPDCLLVNYMEGLLAIFSPRCHCSSSLQLVELGAWLPFLCLPCCNLPPLACCRLISLLPVYLLSTLQLHLMGYQFKYILYSPVFYPHVPLSLIT